MKPGEFVSRLDRAQRSKRFQVIASVVVLVLGIVAFSAWFIAVHAPAAERFAEAQRLIEAAQAPAGGAATGPTIDAQATLRSLRSSSAVGSVALGVFVGVALWQLVIWLGLGLTYLALALATALIAVPLYLIDSTRALGQLLLGAAALSASFAVLIRAAMLALGGSSPTMAIARNVLAEAVRMKISLVFIVLLVFLLAGMPMLLDPESLLRYRVQSFLQYSVSGSFWALALLTLFFSVGTVAFEQRDRIIWQTMSKPVNPASYLLGKWLGVVTLNLVLLSVTSTGVFLFTEHLRNQPAVGESEPYINADGTYRMTPDREILENQVLVARVASQMVEKPVNPDDIEALVQARVDDLLARDPVFRNLPNRLNKIIEEFEADEIKRARSRQRALVSGEMKTFRFEGLEEAKGRAIAQLQRGVPEDQLSPVTLRFKIHSGADNPGSLFRVQFIIDQQTMVNETPLDVTQTIPLSPLLISDDGSLTITVVNGDMNRGLANASTIHFNPKVFEILYIDGGYESNFVRVMILQLVKLAFIAAVGVAASTFLSFPIACMLTILALIASESGGYLQESLGYFPIKEGGEFKPVNFLIQIIAGPIAWVFKSYAELKPTTNLIDGRRIAWSGLVAAVSLITLACGALLTIGWAIFRKRELAIYSGR